MFKFKFSFERNVSGRQIKDRHLQADGEELAGVRGQKLGRRIRLRKPEEDGRRDEQKIGRSHFENEKQILQSQRRRGGGRAGLLHLF